MCGGRKFAHLPLDGARRLTNIARVMESAQLAAADDAYYVLRRGEILGPLSVDELRAGADSGRFAPADLVQHGAAPIWRRAEAVLESMGTALPPGNTTGWRGIWRACWRQLSSDLRAASVRTGVFFVGLGIAIWLLSHWPVTLWLPWFLAPVVAGVLALTRGRLRSGISLLLMVGLVPAAIAMLRPHGAKVAPAPAAPNPARAKAELPQPVPAAKQEEHVPERLVATEVLRVVEPEPVVAQVRQLPPLPPERPMALKAVPPAALANAPDAPPVAPGDLVQRFRDCFVVVKGDEGNGSGFICRLGGRPVLLTNNHVVAGLKQPQFTQLSGARVGVGAAEAAAGYDLMRVALTAPPSKALEALTDLEAHARIGDDVVVLGNTGGGGVVTSLEGKLLGIGPDRIEVSSEFIPGNSGSPIVHVKTGRVIGIATYLTKRYEEFAGPARGARSGEVVVRRFGYRIDTAKKWEPVNWATFQSEAAQLRKISQLTGDVFDFLAALREQREPQFSTDTLRRPAMEWVGRTGRSGVSEADRRSATQGFLGSLRLMVRADVVAAESGLRYTFFRDELRQEREIRDRLFKSFDDEVRRMASPSGRAGF